MKTDLDKKKKSLDDGDGGGSFLFGLIKFVGFIAVLIVIFAFIFGVVVRPGYMGVRQITVALPIGPKQGFSVEGLEPGYHWNIPFYSRVHHVPQDIQILHIHRDKKRYPKSEGALEVQTTDGSSVLVDISVLSRFFEKPGDKIVSGKTIHHGGPSNLVKGVGATESLWVNTVRRVSVDELRRALGRLSTSEFYDPHKRETQISEAMLNMNEKLMRFGIFISAVLLRRYTYQEDRIDKAIFSKNLQDQEERLNAAASKLAEAKAKSERVAAEWDAKIETLKVEGENKVRVIKSEADLYEAEKKADGDLVVAKSTAEVDKLRAGVLAKTAGADVYVAREMAPLLSSLKGGVVSDLDPFNTEDWAKRFGVKGAK